MPPLISPPSTASPASQPCCAPSVIATPEPITSPAARPPATTAPRPAWAMLLGSVLFALLQLITVIPYALACLLVAPAPRRLRYRFIMGWPQAMLWAARVLCGIRWQVTGATHLPTGPAVLLAKHQSAWETFFLPSYMPRELCFVFKRELLRIPFFGWGMALLDMIHIDRSQGRDAFEAVVTQGQRVLDEGRWVIMFPEGTRTPVGGQGRYKSGGARLAIRTGVPIVPIAINAGECWPKRRFLKTPGCVTVSIGPPIASQGRNADELTAEVERWIETEMRRLSPHVYPESVHSAVHETTP